MTEAPGDHRLLCLRPWHGVPKIPGAGRPDGPCPAAPAKPRAESHHEGARSARTREGLGLAPRRGPAGTVDCPEELLRGAMP